MSNRLKKCGFALIVSTLTVFILFLGFAWGDDDGRRGMINKRVKSYAYGTVVMDQFTKTKEIRPVIFRHWVHRSKHTCRLCHTDLEFEMKAGATEVREEDNQAGRYCGACHNNIEAFGWKNKSSRDKKGEDNCSRCHSEYDIGRDPAAKNKFYQMAKTLPKAHYGNRINWTQAHDEGKLKPKDLLPGISPAEDRLKEVHEIKLTSKRKGFPNIIFSHKKHSVWNGCAMCHPYLFAMKTGKTKFEMQDIFEGRYCGACHGSVAFPTQECQSCHTE